MSKLTDLLRTVRTAPYQAGVEKPEAMYERLNELGTRLKLVVPNLRVALEVRDRDGNIVQTHDQRATSLNRNFWNITWANSVHQAPNYIYSQTNWGAGVMSLKVWNGTLATGSELARWTGDHGYYIYGPTSAGSGSTAGGIIVGIGTAAESFDDYALNNMCNEGTGANQLNYSSDGGWSAPTYSAASKIWSSSRSRQINNNSAGTIAVTEVAIRSYWAGFWGGHSGVMFERTKLSAAVNVLPGGLLTVTYGVTYTFPA